MHNTLQVLLVQHDDAGRNQLSSLLRYKKVDVTAFSTAMQALHFYERTEVHLLLIVDHLYDMPAAEVISLIKNGDKVILGAIYLTSESDSEVEKMAEDAGVDLILSHNSAKPNYNALFKEIEKFKIILSKLHKSIGAKKKKK